jgi:hypothetical protein
MKTATAISGRKNSVTKTSGMNRAATLFSSSFFLSPHTPEPAVPRLIGQDRAVELPFVEIRQSASVKYSSE